MNNPTERIIDRAIKEYNKYRVPEVKASLIEFNENMTGALPACANRTNLAVFKMTGIDSALAERNVSLLLAAKAAGYTVNPNCSNSVCQGLWSGIQVVSCTEVSIQ